MVIIPLHLGNHWCCAVVDILKREIRYYDSLFGDNYGILNTILDYLSQEHSNKKNSSLDTSNWNLIIPKKGN
ncbi:Sentrin-specific protease 1 [Smittium mucronatum]|uniref:Sentrin-specific protease 1 n=1 Tax=Smittium mucronatum TaxID=133383 RepID=A0A1R0GPG4_9FUNG|nr:Sentrin-specific protease 1 [Smittium mucronatum]